MTISLARLIEEKEKIQKAQKKLWEREEKWQEKLNKLGANADFNKIHIIDGMAYKLEQELCYCWSDVKIKKLGEI